ncbi:hypothetical protein [Pelagicoccus enzymogenes]|uniref:hypothetical protein n=1 Tax=Pelagicoccus enzymogenes TaxID=2773457 RepID=UPI00281262B2|nr:hypothetical protein [Pelagicoccus enzymogenes]
MNDTPLCRRAMLSRSAWPCFKLAPLALLVPLASLSAQEEEEPIFELSPFSVSADDQDGYLSKSTTAGTRIRTDVKDLGAQIDVFSNQFLEDIGASSPDEAFIYSLNIEGEAENPDYGDGSRARFERDGPTATARGLGNSRTTGATRGRNYFETQLRTHNYNMESLAISSGPNSILFGLGQAGGTINSTLALAHTNEDSGSLTVKLDKHGSFEWYADFNKVLIQDHLALRVAILNNQTNSFMDGNYDDQQRLYGALTYRVNDKMNFRIHFEDIDEIESPTQYRMFQDNISPWLYDGGGVLYDPVDGARPRNQNGASGREAILITPDGRVDVDTVGITKWNNSFGSRSDEAFDYIEYVSVNGITSSPLYDDDFFASLDDRRVSFSPETLDDFGLPFATVNPWGDTMRRSREAEILTAFAEFNPLENLFIEVGYNDENYNGRQYGYNRSFNYGVFIDTQKFLPDGSPNPMAGQLFMQDEGWAWETPKSEKEFRVMASYSYDFKDNQQLSDKLVGFLGKHNVGAMYADRDSMEIRANSFQIWKQNDDGTTPSFLTGGATRVDDPNHNWLRTGDRRVSMRQYLLPENNYQLQVVEGMAPGQELVSFPDPGGTGNLQAGFFDPEIGSNRLFSFDRNVESKMFTYQGYFWNDRLILTYGKREDELKERDLYGAGDRADNYTEEDWNNGLVPDHVIPGGYFPWWTELDWDEYGESGINSNETKGAVFRPVGVAEWLSFFYNEGSNNSAGTIRYDAYGGRNAPITGEGTDYGFRIDTLNNKLQFKVNWYETDSQNVETGGGSVDGDVRGVFRTLEERLEETDPAGYTTNGFDIFGQTDLFLPVADKSAKGTEYTLSYQPKRGWNMRLTAAKTSSVLDNIATSYIKWGDERTPLWRDISWMAEDPTGDMMPVVDWWNNDDPRNDILELRDPSDPSLGYKTPYELRVDAGFTRIDPATGEIELDPDTGEPVAYWTKLGSAGDSPISGWENVARDENSGNPETVKEYFDREFLVDVKGRISQLNGRPNPNVRKWRVNYSTSYQFQDGRFKNFRVGGSVRYRDKGVVGYGRTKFVDEASGNEIDVLDISNPYYNDSEVFVDGMVSYSGSFNDDKLRYRIQLNVRNLFDNSDLYVTDVSTSGRELVWATFEPRTYTLTTSFDF